MPTAKTAVELPEVPDFDHVNINDVNPDFEAIKTGFYPLQLVKTDEVTKVFGDTIKSGDNAGQPNPRAGEEYRMIKLQFSITEGDFAARRVFKTLFEGRRNDYKFVARLARAVAMPQEAGESLTNFLTRIAEAEIPFKGKIKETPDDPYNDNALDDFDIQAL